MEAKAPRNRTISLSAEEETALLTDCLSTADLAAGADPVCRIIRGDCLKALPLLPMGYAGLLIADPPYNRHKKYASSPFSEMSDSSYYKYTMSWLRAAISLLSPSASVYVCCDWRDSAVVMRALSDTGLKIRSRITWQREKGRGSRCNYKNAMEDIWFATVSDDYFFDPDSIKLRRRVLAPYRESGKPRGWNETSSGAFRDTYASNFWDDISVPFWSMPENTEHPTQKPEKLMARIILASSRPDDLILDPFAGSGSSCVAAKKLGRKYTGIEREARYCALALKRLNSAFPGAPIQGYSDGVFWERNSAPPR